MKKAAKLLFRYIIFQRKRNRLLKIGETLLSNFHRKTLTQEEKQEVREYWGRLGHKNVKFTFHELYKTTNYYDKHYIPEDLYASIVLVSLNPRLDSNVYVNKGMYDILFDEIPQPKCLVKNIASTYWIGKKSCSMKEVCDYLCKNSKAFIIKPSIDTFGGANVKKVNLLKVEYSEQEQYIESLLKSYKSDFVIQEIIKQNEETAQFNPESLNTIRICSLFLNNRLSILTRLLRCGQNGSTVDNGSAGGIMIPINQNGELFKYGFDHYLNKYETSFNGIVFNGIVLKNYPKLELFIRDYHILFPTCHLIAWDLAIDENGNPIMVEVNLCSPGITEEQVSIGPFFGERTDEVIEYVKENPGELYMSF